MSDEKTSKNLTALFSFLPVATLLLIDLYTMFLQPQAKAVSHLAFGVLIAQLLCCLVFVKGEICNGQRSRLIRVNLYFVLYWALWFLLSLFSNYHYVLTDMICLCGIIMLLAVWQQPPEEGLRKSVLMMGAVCGVVGLICYGLMLIDIPMLIWVQYNLFAQILMGVVLTNLTLVTSRNRLQGFIGLLPLLMMIALLLNAIAVLGVLANAHFVSAVSFLNDFAFVLYFALHLVAAAVLAVHIWRKINLSYRILMMLLIISASLPLWATFAYIR